MSIDNSSGHDLSPKGLHNALEELNVPKSSVVYITGNIGRLGHPKSSDGGTIREKDLILKFYADKLLDYLGPEATIIFPTHSWSLVNTNIVFDRFTTPSDYLFPEYLRRNLCAARQIHPFASVAAYGKNASLIVNSRICRHPYGPSSPFAILHKIESYHLSLGLQIKHSFSAAHYCEFVCGVPYRYTKSFRQKIIDVNGRIKEEEFFLYVIYHEACVERDRNNKAFKAANIIPKRVNIGKSFIESIRLDSSLNNYINCLEDDPYIWTKSISIENKKEPWRI